MLVAFTDTLTPQINLNKENPPIEADSGRINFNAYIKPFTDLLAYIKTQLVKIARYLVQFNNRYMTAAEVVFYRLFHSLTFDPLHSTFKEKIDQFEQQIPLFNKRIDSLALKFGQLHLIPRHLKDVKQLDEEINKIFEELDYFVHAIEQRQPPFPIYPQLVKVREAYQGLKNAIADYLIIESSSIFHKFQQVMQIFIQSGLNLPEDIRLELIQFGNMLIEIFADRIPARGLSELKAYIKRLEDNPHIPIALQETVLEPLKLRNIGNSCYMDSVFQALFSLDMVCEEFKKPIVCNKQGLISDHKKRVTIQQEILQFLNVRELNGSNEVLNPIELILFLFQGPSLYRVRDAIFSSNFHPEFDKRDLNQQLDAAAMMELLIDQFLPCCKFKMEEHATTKDLPGLEFVGPADEVSMLQIPFRQGYKKFYYLIRWVIDKHVEKATGRLFNPKDDKVKITNEEQSIQSQAIVPYAPSQFTQWYCLKELPNILVCHFKRFTNTGARLIKVDHPVELPADGMVDLSKFTEGSARYKIKSYVVHRGDLNFGHYVAYVEIHNKYYYCDDLDQKYYQEISKKEFFESGDAYLVVLEKLSDFAIGEPIKIEEVS